jgi:hypothetical protein
MLCALSQPQLLRTKSAVLAKTIGWMLLFQHDGTAGQVGAQISIVRPFNSQVAIYL